MLLSLQNFDNYLSLAPDMGLPLSQQERSRHLLKNHHRSTVSVLSRNIFMMLVSLEVYLLLLLLFMLLLRHQLLVMLTIRRSVIKRRRLLMGPLLAMTPNSTVRG